jgi:hypothetical protein
MLAETILIILLVVAAFCAALVAFMNALAATDAAAFGVKGVFTPWPILIALALAGLAIWAGVT